MADIIDVNLIILLIHSTFSQKSGSKIYFSHIVFNVFWEIPWPIHVVMCKMLCTESVTNIKSAYQILYFYFKGIKVNRFVLLFTLSVDC